MNSKEVAVAPIEPMTTHEPGTLPDVFRLVEQLQRKLSHVQRETVRHTGLTPPQYAALTQLWTRDKQPLKDLAAGNHCTAATMTSLVDGLERKGLVTRRPHPDDRRSLQVCLTPEGAALQGSAPSVAEMFRGCCTGLSPAETEALAALLAKLDGALRRWQAVAADT
jgi:DNA-binding MarR family transcriptional regulator